jgi:hypothetical protein
MKKSMNFYAPMWLLVLGFTIACFSSCSMPDGDPMTDRIAGDFVFAFVDSNANNICKSKENSPYDVDAIKIVMHDGYEVQDLYYYTPGQGQNDSSHPSTRGLVFGSHYIFTILADFTEAHKKYSDKPFYLIINEEDTDTLMWNSQVERFFHNGKEAPVDNGSYGGSPHMLIKGKGF